MKTLEFEEVWRFAEERSLGLGLYAPEATEQLRNKGGLRTPEKREMLRRIKERAAAAGIPAFKAYK